MFNGINIAGVGFGPVGTTLNGVAQTGALHLRNAAASNLRGNLANGNYSALATSLASLNYSTSAATNPGNESLPFVPFGVNGSVLRRTGFPENFILTNPQFSAATYQTNGAHSNYHSLQVQGTLRPTYGFNLQTSYTWSKNLGVGLGGFTDPRNQALDYTLLPTHRTHVVRTNGTFDLPVGPGPASGGEQFWYCGPLDRGLDDQLDYQSEFRFADDDQRRQHALWPWNARSSAAVRF